MKSLSEIRKELKEARITEANWTVKFKPTKVNGIKVDGKPITVKARASGEAIIKAAKTLGIDKKSSSIMNATVDLDEAVVAEAKVSGKDREELDDLILGLVSVSGPDDYGYDEAVKKYGTEESILKKIKSKFGEKIAKDLEDGIDKMHFPRTNHTSGSDPLSGRGGKTRTTKSGKANKMDIKGLKSRIKWDRKMAKLLAKPISLQNEAK